MTLKRTDEEMKWKTLLSEYVVKEPWMKVRKDKLLLPDGRVKDDYWSLEYPDWINVIATTKDGHYIYERQYRHGLDCVAWEIPAGVIEKGEEPRAAARRELMEETGFGGGEWEPFMELSPNPGTNNNIAHTFLARGVEREGEQHFDSAHEFRFQFCACPLWHTHFFVQFNSDDHVASLLVVIVNRSDDADGVAIGIDGV